MSETVRVVLPAHLRAMAKVQGEVTVAVPGEVTQRSVLDALEADYPMLLGTTMVGAIIVVLVSLLADIAYALLDPRVRLSE